MKNDVVIAGAGAHCKVVLDIIQDTKKWNVAGLLDTCNAKKLLGVPVLGPDSMAQSLYDSGIQHAFVAVGDNHVRAKITSFLASIGFEMITIISRYAVVSQYAEVGAGTVVMPGAIVNAEAHIGNGCILNTNCSVDHDCDIGDFCHIAPGCAISGSTAIGEYSFLGTRAAAIDRVNIGTNVMIGAGAVVVGDIPDNCTALGVPARVVRYK